MLIATATTAHAQSAPAATDRTSPDQGSPSVGEVIVTATKHSEQLRNVASTVAVVTGNALAAAGPITGTGDLLATVPGARFNDLQDPLLSEVSIRGSGTERATGADSSVGLFRDGAYVGGALGTGRNFSPIDSFDLDRAEVLEGPQGALYGRNAEFGVVNLISAQPTFSDSGYLDDSYTFQTKANQLTAVVNHPINDEVAVRLGAQNRVQSGGFIYNPDTNSYYDSTSGWMGRAQVRVRHGALDVDFLADTQDMRLPSFASPLTIPGGGKFPLIPGGYSQSRFVVPHNGQDLAQEKVNDLMLTVKYDFGWGTLSSTSMARTHALTSDFDTDYIDLAAEAALQAVGARGMYPFGQSDSTGTTTTLYQDLHFAGVAFDERLNWLAGVELLREKSNIDAVGISNPCATRAAPNLAVGAGICSGTPTNHICYLVTPTSTPCPAIYPSQFGSNLLTSQVYNSQAVYASLSYKIGFGFILAADARYTNDDKTANRNGYALYTTTPITFTTGGTVPNPTDYSFHSSIPTYTATLSYKIPGSWGDLLYAKVGTGYREGGFNFGLSPPVAPVPLRPTYNNETSVSYEGGIKGNITHFVYFTLDGYASTTQNALAVVTDGCTVLNACAQAGTPFTVNAGKVRASGIEASLNTALNVLGGVLSLEVDGSTQTASYVSVSSTFKGLPILGTPVAQNPRWLAGSTLNYRHPIADQLDGFINLVYHGQWGGVQDTITPTDPLTRLSNFNNIDLRTGIDYRNFEFAFFADNLTNESYVELQLNLATTGVGVAAVPYQQRWNEPRTLGAEAKYKW